MFAYPDAQRYRLGANYTQLPTNRARCPVYAPYERDGAATHTRNYGGEPNYVRSSLTPGVQSNRVKEFRHTEHLQACGALGLNEIPVTDDDFVQPRALWNNVFDDAERRLWVSNISGTLEELSEPLRAEVIAMFSKVDPKIGQMITAKLRGTAQL